jgi:hypothetical protein
MVTRISKLTSNAFGIIFRSLKFETLIRKYLRMSNGIDKSMQYDIHGIILIFSASQSMS